MANRLGKLASGLVSLVISLGSLGSVGCYEPPSRDYFAEERARVIQSNGLTSKEDISKLNEASRRGMSSYFAAQLIKQNVPIDYALSKKDKFAFFQIASMYHSPFRNAKFTDKKTREVYGENVFYTEFKDLQISPSEEKEEIPIPKDLMESFVRSSNLPRIKDEAKFEGEFLKHSGKTLEEIAKLNPKELVGLAVDTTARKMKYRLVDDDKDFIGVHGRNLTADEYFYIGEGDCDKYAYIVQAGFEVLKRHNDIARNVHVSSGVLGGKYKPHAWNSVIVLNGSDLFCAHIDPTNYGNPMEGKERVLDTSEEYVPKDPNEFRELFYDRVEMRPKNKPEDKAEKKEVFD